MPKRSAAADPVLLGLVAVGVLLVPWFLRFGDQPRVSWGLQTALDALLIAPEEFTDTPVHLTPEGATQFAALLAPTILDIAN